MTIDYQKAKVYKIYSTKPELKGCYVGSTCKTLAERMSNHRVDSRNTNKKRTLYTMLREHGCGSFKIELLELAPCNSRDELRVMENKWITKLDTVNNGWNCKYEQFDNMRRKEQIKKARKKYNEANKDNITRYYQTNKLQILQKQKQYYQSNKGMFKCSTCNKAYDTNPNLNRHYKSKKHIRNIDTVDTDTTTVSTST